MELVVQITFLSLSNSDLEFGFKKLIWSSYIIFETLPKVKKVELINRPKFAEIVLDQNVNNFVIYVAALEAQQAAILMHFLQTLLIFAL